MKRAPTAERATRRSTCGAPSAQKPEWLTGASRRRSTACPTVVILRVVVRDLDPELILELHDQLHQVERIGVEVFLEGGLFGDYVLVEPELLDEALPSPVRRLPVSTRHVTSRSLVGARLRARRSYTGHARDLSLCRQLLGELCGDVVLDATSSERMHSRSRSATSFRGAIRPARAAEQVCAAVGVGVRAGGKAAGGGPDQEPAQLAERGLRDLLAEALDHGADRPLERLQRDVAREPVGDDDVCGLASRSRLRCCRRSERAGREQAVRLEHELVALLRLLADREQAYLGLSMPGSPRRRSSPCGRTGAGARLARRRWRAVEQHRGAVAGPGSARRSPGESRRAAALISSSPAASMAPVFPAETTASALPSPTARQAATSELSGFPRTASAGLSSISITCSADHAARARARRAKAGP